MAKPRKRPAKPAEDQPEQPAEVPPAPAPVVPRVARPPKPHQPIAQVVEPLVPRNPDDVIHNVVVRQLADDIENPPKEAADTLPLDMLTQIMCARRDGKTLEPFKPELTRMLQSTEELYKLVWLLYRRHRCGQLVDWLSADDVVTRFLMRCFRRGDLTPTEALVFKRMSVAAIKELVEEHMKEMQEGTSLASASQANDLLGKLDLNLKVGETATHSILSKTTPQGREIVRKLVFTARQKMFPNLTK